MQGEIKEYQADTVIAREGDLLNNLFYVQSGSVLVCQLVGSEIKVLARIGSGEFLGELSFFDNRPRSSYLITLDATTLIEIPNHPTLQQFPYWFRQTMEELIRKMRQLDRILHESRIKKSDLETSRPLSLEEQTKYYRLLTN